MHDKYKYLGTVKKIICIFYNNIFQPFFSSSC